MSCVNDRMALSKRDPAGLLPQKELSFQVPSKWRVFFVKHMVLPGDNLSKDIAIQVISRGPDKMSAAEMNANTQNHLGIENKSHYIPDTVWREDGNQTWIDDGPHSLAIL
jgi:hypothetical protein